jgi:hypothetical protein
VSCWCWRLMCGQIVNPIWGFFANLEGNGMLGNTCKYNTRWMWLLKRTFVKALFGPFLVKKDIIKVRPDMEVEAFNVVVSTQHPWTIDTKPWSHKHHMCLGWIEYLFVKVGLTKSSHRLWGFISQTCGRQEVGTHEDSWLSFVDATIDVNVLVRVNGSGAMDGYYVANTITHMGCYVGLYDWISVTSNIGQVWL